MKNISKRRLSGLVNTMLAGAALFGLSSCNDFVYDSDKDCAPKHYLQFIFDRNLLVDANTGKIGTNAFDTQVTSVDVYVFDAETGSYVAHWADNGEALTTNNYLMPFELPAGEYDVIAWCGLANNDNHFTVPETLSLNTEAKCHLTRKTDDFGIIYSDEKLHDLFHGRRSLTIGNDETGDYIYKVSLTKDTNHIQLLLQHNAQELDANRFTVSLTETNGHMAHDNSLLKDDDIQFRPWSVYSGVLEPSDLETKAEEEGSGNTVQGFIMAELTTGRLMSDRNTKIVITDNNDGREIFSLPLVKYSLMYKSARYPNMESQEYLDRKDTYELMVILDNNEDNDGFFAKEIRIEGWHVIDNGDFTL